jgi:hypothetical protein
VQKERELAAMHQKTRHANAMATTPSAETTHVATTATQATPADTVATTAMQPPRPTHTVSSNSASVAQSRHAAETPDPSFVHRPNSRTNWKKLKEQASRDQSKRREVLIAVNSDACSVVLLILTKENLPDGNND